MAKSVIVVGGGIAGLTAASRLAQNSNFTVVLLEGSDRVGGRVHTVKEEFAGQTETVELGAQCIHGEGSIYNLAKSYGEGLTEDNPFLELMETNSDFGTSSGKGFPPDVLKKCFELYKVMGEGPSEKDCKDISFGNWFLNKIKADLLSQDARMKAFIEWLEKLQMSVDAPDSWHELSVRGTMEYKTCPGCPTIFWTQGYQTLINIILNENPSVSDLPSWVKLNSKVTEINYSQKPIVTRTEDGTIYEADAVIVAVSLGVLKSVHGTLFQPELPAGKVQTIENLGFGTVNKIHCKFEATWWDAEWLGLNLLWMDEDREEFPKWATSILGFYTFKSCPRTLTAWITGEQAREMEKVDIEEVSEMVHKILRRFMNKDNIPKPTVSMTKWFNDPLFRGCYSFRSVQSEENDVWAKDLAEPIPVPSQGLLCFAGEATHSCYYATVHGAYDTGVREANRLTQFFDEMEK
ncbi:unnamed protein product [Allacma fusca]|uniref:Amine oxidase domain-containing protein n=1 Tax=Allacma fusca TaxID=39272 RepID=A0A8J2KMT6_9HEXA|nr:unnamed protein product [Allacma fusca]